MKSVVLGVLTVGILLAIAAGAYDLAQVGKNHSAQGRLFLRIVSGPAGGTWYPLGAKMSQLFARDVPMILSANAPGGGIENVRDVDRRNAEMGFSVADAVDSGYRGTGKFLRPLRNIRHFATTYINVFQIAVPKDSSIRTIADLKDKNISPGKAGWSGTAVARSVLAAHGIDFESIKQHGGAVHHVDYSDSVALMKDGHIDAFMVLSSVPQSSMMELDFDPGIRLLNLERDKLREVLNTIPGSASYTIPKSTYGNLPADVKTLGIPVVLMIHKDVPEDLVYHLTKSFWQRHQEMVEVSPVWNTVKLQDALLAASAPIHPGAMRYYRQMGVTVPERP